LPFPVLPSGFELLHEISPEQQQAYQKYSKSLIYNDRFCILTKEDII
jgi:hypothetical protein